MWIRFTVEQMPGSPLLVAKIDALSVVAALLGIVLCAFLWASTVGAVGLLLVAAATLLVGPLTLALVGRLVAFIVEGEELDGSDDE